MPTLDDLLREEQPQQDDSAALQELFAQTFDLDGWQFEQQGSIPYAILHGENDTKLNLTVIPALNGYEWQLNGISILSPNEAELSVEEKRMRLVEAARRTRYQPRQS